MRDVMQLVLIHVTGNSNLVYTIIRKRNVFHQLANLPTDQVSITQALTRRGKKSAPAPTGEAVEQTMMEGALPPVDAEPGTLKASLAATPGLFHFSSPLFSIQFKKPLVEKYDFFFL